MKKEEKTQLPEIPELERALEREKYKRRYRNTLKSTVYALITVAAVAVLVATLWLPVLEIYGGSMVPTLENGQIVVSWKTENLKPGQIVAFYYNNKILVKRVIGKPGDWVNIDEAGNVYVNDVLLDEPYIAEKALGECDIELPFQVPENRVFVMGDHRATSIDSRSSVVGCISEDQIVGRLLLRIWPLEDFGTL